MKKILFIMMAILPMLLFTGCSDDNEEEELSQEAKAAKTQDELYNKVLSVIVGHWKGYQHYNTSTGKWRDISETRWSQEYIFNSDGTCKDIYSPKLIFEGTYSITKNGKYIQYPLSYCELLLTITYNDGVVDEHVVWMDGEYLRLAGSFLGMKPSNSDGGEASIRYKKE